MRAGTALALAATLFLAAGCAGGGGPGGTATTATFTSDVPNTLTPSTAPLQETFGAPTLPPGWQADAGAWAVVANATAPSPPNVLQGTGGGGRSTLRSDAAYVDFEATLHFLMVSGDEGAGLAFRYEPDGDYRIVRFSVREDGWHYFVVEDGKADKRHEASIGQDQSRPQHGQWVALKVRAEGRHVQAWDGDVLVIDYAEDEDPDPGRVGPFLRGGATALFDDLRVDPL